MLLRINLVRAILRSMALSLCMYNNIRSYNFDSWFLRRQWEEKDRSLVPGFDALSTLPSQPAIACMGL